jgi:hypothetical protein
MLIIEREPSWNVTTCWFHWGRSENSKQRCLRVGGFNLGASPRLEHGKTTADYKREPQKCAHSDHRGEAQLLIPDLQAQPIA